MTEPFNRDVIVAALRSLVAGRGTLYEAPGAAGMWLIPTGTGIPLFLEIHGDTAYVRPGMGIAIPIPNDEPGDDGIVIEVVDAIIRGNAEAYLRLDSNRSTGSRVWYSGGERSGATDGANAAIVHFPAWSESAVSD
jgi:hypothetical protein